MSAFSVFGDAAAATHTQGQMPLPLLLPESSLWPGTSHPCPDGLLFCVPVASGSAWLCLLGPAGLWCGKPPLRAGFLIMPPFPSLTRKKPHNLIEKVRKNPHISLIPPRSQPFHVPSERPAPVLRPPWITNLSGSSINSLCPQGHFTCCSEISLLLFTFLHTTFPHFLR